MKKYWKIVQKMHNENVHNSIVIPLGIAYEHYEGLRDLMEMWDEEEDEEERWKIILDIAHCLDDIFVSKNIYTQNLRNFHEEKKDE